MAAQLAYKYAMATSTLAPARPALSLPFPTAKDEADLDLMRATYIYNPQCGCAWCANAGNVPERTTSNGHSFGYEAPHIPPSRRPWTQRPNKDA